MKNRRNTVIFLKRVTAALLSAAMVLSNLGFGGTGSISSKASTGSDTSAWSASAMMEKTGKTELYDAVKEYYTAVGTTDANAGKQEIWSRGAEKDFADIEFRDPVYSDGNKTAEVEIDITPADADTKINYVRTAGYFGDEGYATLSDATEASPANASGSNAGRKTWKFLTNVSWNDPAFVIYYTIPTEGDNGKLQWNAMDSEWVVEDDAVTDIANGAAAVLKCTDTVEISDITKLYEAYVKYLNGDTMSLEKLLASDVTDENGNKVTGLSISTDGLKSLFEDKERMAAQVDILKSAGYETALTAGSSFEELAAAYKTYPVSSYNSFFSAFTEKRSGTGKKAVRILATLLSAAGNPASSDTESNVVEVDLTKTIQNRTASTARKITFLEGPVLLGGVDENYMKLSDTGSITDVSEFDIGAINTQYITFSGYCKKISASNTDTGRKLIVKIPKGFTVSPATGFGDLDDSNKGFTFEGKDTTSDDNYVIYTWSWPDGADYTSAISFDGIQAKQDPAYLINHLTEGKTYDFIMECVNDSGTFDTRSFSLAPNSRTASYTVSSEVKTFSPSDLKTSFSQYSDPLPAGNPGSEFGTLDTKYFSVKVTKTEGHLPETFNIAVPCPSELASAITRMGYVHIVFTDANSKTTALFEYNRVGGDWSSWSYDSTAKMFHISLDGAAMASAFKVLNTGSTVEDDILKAGTIEFQYTFRVDQNKLPLEQTGTLLGNPKPMGTEITMTAEDAITLNYNTFAAADHAALSAAGSQFGLKWHNGTPSITHPYKINDNDNYQYTKQAQGTVTDAKAEIFKDASSGSAFQSHFSVAMEYEEAFSPVNIATSYSRYDQDADLDFTYTVTVTSLDASGNSLGTETMSENPEQGEVISIDETALSALKKSGAASWYVSKIEITNPSLTTVSSGDLNLSLKYRALKNTQAGIAAGEDKIPNNYPATIKYTYGSDQFSTVTETAKVLLIDTLDNLYLKSVTDLSGDSSSVPVNENVAMYLLGQFVITKYQDTMTYQAPFPTAVVSGKGLGLADYFSATDQKIISYTDEKGTVHQVSEDVLKSATEDYSGRATGDASYSGKNHLYNLKKIFDQCGGTYAVSVTLSLYAVNDWACTQLLWGGPNGRYMGYDHYASFYASKVMPGYMGYDEIVKKGTVAGLSDLGDAYDYHVELTCNSSAHTDFNHNKLNGKTAKLVRGDVPGGIEVRDISYYLAGALSSAASGKPNYMFNEWVGAEYAPRRAFLAGMQITGWNKGSAGRRNMNLHNLVFDFSGSDPDALALTQGISFSITQGSLPWTFRGSPRYEAYNSARYLDNRDGAKTDAGVMSGDQTKSTYKVLYTTKQGSKGEKTCYFSVSSSPYDYVYQDLTDCLKDSSDYFTSLKITMSPLGAIGWADTFGISDVLPTPMLVHKGGIPKAYPDSKIAVGEKHLSAAYSATVSGGMEDNENYDQLPIRAVMSFNDIYGTTVTKLEAEGKTARIAGQKIIYNTLYASAGYSTDAVFQGKTFDASLYLWIRETDAPTATDPAFKPRPVFYVKMDKDFKYTGKARYSTSDYGTVNFTYVEPGTEAGESGSSDYGFLVIDLSQSYGLYRDRYKYDASLFNCTVTLEASPYAKVGQYNAEIGSRPIPIKTVWADVAYDRNSRGTSETVNNRNYSVDLDKLSTAEKVTQVKQTDSAGIAAPYGENYNNSPDADYPARDTTADGRDNAEMLLAELDTGKTVSASSTAGMYMRAIAHMPYQYASSVTSKDILKADEDGYKLFGADINIIGYKENDTHDWVSYIPIPRQSSVLSHKTGKYTDDFGLKLISLDTSGVDDAKDFEIWYSTDPAPDKNGLSGGSDSGYTKLTKEQVTGGKLPEGITMLKLTAAVMPKATRDNLTLSYRMQSHKTDIGIKKAYSTLWYNFQNVGETSYQTKNGFEDAVCTYSLTDMYVTGKVWMEADYNSVYNSTDTLLKGREVKLLDPLNSAAEVNQGTKILTASDGSYVLTAPHDGKLTVQVIPDQTEQFVEQFKKSTAAGTHVADESWFDRSTGKTTDVNFVSDYFTSGYTMKYVDAGLALNPVITTTPVKVHIGDISDPATVNVTNIKDGSVPAVAADPAHSQEMTVTDNGDGTYTVKSEGTEKKTGLSYYGFRGYFRI